MQIELLLIEAAKLALQSFFIQMNLANKSEEEILKIYTEEREKFKKNKPEDLPIV